MEEVKESEDSELHQRFLSIFPELQPYYERKEGIFSQEDWMYDPRDYKTFA